MRAFFLAIGLIWLAAVRADALEIEEERWFGTPGSGAELHILSTTDTHVFAPLLEAWRERRPDLAIRYVVTSTKSLHAAFETEGAVFDLGISSAMDLQMKLANDGIALPHRSQATQGLPDWARWRDQLFAFTQEPVVTALSLDGLDGLSPPRTRGELIRLMRARPEMFRGRIGTYDPALSGAGYLFASQDARQSDTYWRLSEVMGSLDPALYSATGAMIDDLQAGRLIMAYNVLGPYLNERMTDWPAGQIVEMRDYTHVLLRTAFIPKSAEHPDESRAFLDFLISQDGQNVLDEATSLPPIDEAALAAAPHLHPIRLDPGLLVYADPLKKQNFLSEWTSAVVQP